MKRIQLSQSNKQVKVILTLKGGALIVYSMRLWNKGDDNMRLVKELRGSCFNEGLEELTVDISESSEYFVELSANINTTLSDSNFSIQLSFIQSNQENVEVVLDEVTAFGQIGYNDGGKYKAIGVALVVPKTKSLEHSAA